MHNAIMSYCLIGAGIARSPSPFLHKLFFKAEGIRAEYSLYECGELPGFITEDLFCGMNITVPFKTRAAEKLREFDSNAVRAGAVNCVYRCKGYNTDYSAFSEVLGDVLSGGICIKSALIIGRGGVARALAVALADKGIGYTLAVRGDKDVSTLHARVAKKFDGNPRKALSPTSAHKEANSDYIQEAVGGDALATSANKLAPCNAQQYDQRIKTDIFESAPFIDVNSIKGEYDLIINATPYGRDFSLPPIIGEDVIKKSKYVFDVSYHETTLRAVTESIGIPFQNGLRMLVLQAAHSHKIWNLPYEKINIEESLAALKKFI